MNDQTPLRHALQQIGSGPRPTLRQVVRLFQPDLTTAAGAHCPIHAA